ncbi:TrkH family potassium uptake protein [Sinorhizobium numidicum]|uniref:Trk system potassium uptake protein n=1 Tax=Sinorhizobium numidicum TaxID=680248 RepID=A0ABY8CVI4_9HYPH|nr:TrkH family potassium uptake protein [Sinorhizobium numidicum]WEX75268.1 TrkH family potassium uptake protein [Sinorhizobium numidicum]WEX81263.1 TrkH family potassium uptake protein [Sinorhizobium numidicum]
MTADRLRFVLFLNGVFILAVALAMLLPAIVDVSFDNPQEAANFVTCSAVAGGFGVLLMAAFRQGEVNLTDRRTGFLITVSAWLSVSIVGAVPLYASSLGLSWTDAVFEAASALTTTGSTILVGLDQMPEGLLIWRSLLQWLGGIGIIVMALSVLPGLRVGGMQLFRSESSDVSEKPFPKVRQIARNILIVYSTLTLACAVSLAIAGMPTFDAVNHAMTTIATGGLSTKDASIGYYNSVPIEVVTQVFMISGALPLAFYAVFLLTRGKRRLVEGQIRPFLLILAAAILTCTVWNISQGTAPPTALRLSAFNVTSIMTDTGFATADFSTWGSFAVGLFFMLYLVGGCAGSTAGAIKIFRWQLLFAGVGRVLQLMLYPNAIVPVRFQGKSVDDAVISNVRNFFFLYIITLLLLSLMVMATGLDFLSAISSVAQGMANAGPGLGPIVGPATNFSSIPDAAKWLIVLAMILGRLELVNFFIVLQPWFWRR